MLLLPEARHDPWYATSQAYKRVRSVVEKGFGSAWRVDAWVGGREARLLMRVSHYMVVYTEAGCGVTEVEGSFAHFDAAYERATGCAAPRVA